MNKKNPYRYFRRIQATNVHTGAIDAMIGITDADVCGCELDFTFLYDNLRDELARVYGRHVSDYCNYQITALTLLNPCNHNFVAKSTPSEEVKSR